MTPIRMSDPGIAAAKGLEAFGDGHLRRGV